MQLLEQRILTDGIVGENDVLKVGSFLNQQIDTQLLRACAEEFCRLFQGSDVTKVLTVEASGIAIATATAMCLGVLFLPKNPRQTIFPATYIRRMHIPIPIIQPTPL